MIEIKNYMDVVRLGYKSTTGVLNVGDNIVIQEKIDGAIASFRSSNNSMKVEAFSRNTKLDEFNNLGGFFQWVQDYIDPSNLQKNYIYFGEWTNPHKIKYNPEYTKTFFLFDIYNEQTQEYVDYNVVKSEAESIKLTVVPVFYEVKYRSFEHLETFVGKSKLGGKLGDLNTGEGIVVKNMKYKDGFGSQRFVKMVTDSFREVQKQKAPKDPSNNPLR